MPRYRRYTKTIVKAPRKKWNRQHLFANEGNTLVSGNAVWYTNMVVNKIDDVNSPYQSSPSILQATKLKAQMQVSFKSNVTEAGNARPVLTKAYIVYLPQICVSQLEHTSAGADTYTFWRNTVFDNPEFVMGSKVVNNKFEGGRPGEIQSFSFSVTSGKMKRNLKSGDRIFIVFEMTNLNQGAAATYNMQMYCEMEASVTQL